MKAASFAPLPLKPELEVAEAPDDPDDPDDLDDPEDPLLGGA